MTPTPTRGQGSGRVRDTLALHIRRLRQWYGGRGIRQKSLARLADVPVRRLRMYEKKRRLPPTTENLLRIALALGVPMERLIDPARRDALRAEIEDRRKALPSDTDAV